MGEKIGHGSTFILTRGKCLEPVLGRENVIQFGIAPNLYADHGDDWTGTG